MRFELWCRSLPGQYEFVEGFDSESMFYTVVDRHLADYDEFIIIRKNQDNLMCGAAFYYEKPKFEKALKKEGRSR